MDELFARALAPSHSDEELGLGLFTEEEEAPRAPKPAPKPAPKQAAPKSSVVDNTPVVRAGQKSRRAMHKPLLEAPMQGRASR